MKKLSKSIAFVAFAISMLFLSLISTSCESKSGRLRTFTPKKVEVSDTINATTDNGLVRTFLVNVCFTDSAERKYKTQIFAQAGKATKCTSINKAKNQFAMLVQTEWEDLIVKILPGKISVGRANHVADTKEKIGNAVLIHGDLYQPIFDGPLVRN